MNQNKKDFQEPDMWIVDYLQEKNQSQIWGLSPDFFIETFKRGNCLLFIDGLDEAPDRIIRENMSILLENAIKAWKESRFVVTTRPMSYTGRSKLNDFTERTIAPLEEEGINRF